MFSAINLFCNLLKEFYHRDLRLEESKKLLTKGGGLTKNKWLDAKLKNTDKLQKLLRAYSAGKMKSHPVSKNVNIPDVDSDELIKPINSL